MPWFVITLAGCPASAPALDEWLGAASELGEEPVDDGSPPKRPAEAPCTPSSGLVLNEVSPSNRTTLVDVEGESVDWFELYNTDTRPIDLLGWTVSDDPGDPARWTFPSVTMEPGAFLLVHASGKDRSRIVGAWDTPIDQGHSWRYLEVTGPVPDWFQPDFDDQRWKTGASGFGTGDSDDETHASSVTVYVRTELELVAEEVADLAALALHVDYDDGFVAWLNGVEVARVGLGLAGGGPPAWDTLATYSTEARLYQGLAPEYFDLDGSLGLLHEGTNILAIEVHNSEIDSQDLTLVPFLSLGFASARDGAPSPLLTLPTVDLHTNFSLRAGGEPVRLYDPAACEVDVLEPVPLRADESYGRQPDGTGTPGYFMAPTPGAANVTEWRGGFAELPAFDPPPAWYDGGTDVTIATPPGARVHVAWEGKEPTEDDPLYETPLPTGTTGDVVVLRARAWQDGLWPSRIATGSYLLRAPGNLPIVSLVTDPPNLWDEETGIYVVGNDAEPEFPWHGANFHETWQRPVHLEEWEPDGTLGFSVDGSFGIHGGSSRNYEQKNLEITLGGGWGDEAIEAAIFPELDITEYTRLLLRAGGSDWLGCYAEGCIHGTMSRDRLMQALTVGSDLDRMASRPAVAYLNGAYWGIYFLNEKSDLAYVEAHYGVNDIDMLRDDVIPHQGDTASYVAMLDWLRTHDLSDPANYAYVRTLIDVDELQTYLIFEIFAGNCDWPGNNIEYWRPRTVDGRWRWLLFGTEFGLGLKRGDADVDNLGLALAPDGDGWPNPPWSTELFRLLVQSPEFTSSFLNRYADYLNTLLRPDRTLGLNRAFADEIADEIPRHIERWGSYGSGVGPWTLVGGEWEEEVEDVDEWLLERPPHALEHILANFGLAGTWTLTLDVEPAGSGTFELSTVTVEAPFSGTYFQDVPVTITAIPAPGMTFVGWSDQSLPTIPTITVGAAASVVARFQ